MIAAVVLAAGAGTRAGGPKALLEVAGRTALARVVETCRQAPLDAVVVVAGAEGGRVAAEVLTLARGDGPAVRAVVHGGWEAGRTGSLQAGWKELPEDAHVLVFPVDHPAVSVVTLDLLIGVFGYAAASPEAVVPVLVEAGRRRRGHPAILASSLRPRVLALGADEPLHVVVRGALALEVPVDDAGILLDVDTPADAARAAALLRARPPAAGG